MALKIISYNVNGLRAALRKGFATWLEAALPDVLLLQETKAKPEQLDLSFAQSLGYHCYFHSAEKPGYSGVAIWSRRASQRVLHGCGHSDIDREGRVLRADFGHLTLVNVYMPSGSSGSHRQASKMQFLWHFTPWIKQLRQERPHIIVAGDFNICHHAIDIHNPVANKNSPGFLPEERRWLSNFLDLGFADSFRKFHPEEKQYSWWSYRFNARSKNLGWRIDYIFLSKPLEPLALQADILHSAGHSDHCPVYLSLHE